jgi:hypothetical protein
MSIEHLFPEALTRGSWVAHAGLDYACVMLPGEDTVTASISVHADSPDTRDELLAAIAALPTLAKLAVHGLRALQLELSLIRLGYRLVDAGPGLQCERSVEDQDLAAAGLELQIAVARSVLFAAGLIPARTEEMAHG